MDDGGRAAAAEKQRCCLAMGCDVSLSDQPKYCKQRRLCTEHLKAQSLRRKDHHAADQLWRFCQQCGKLEPLHAFDGTKRSCRAKLANRRANSFNRGPFASAGGSAGAAQPSTPSLKPLHGGIRKASSFGAGLDRLSQHSQQLMQEQLNQLPQPQQQLQLLPQAAPPMPPLLQQQHSLALQQQQQEQQQQQQQQQQELEVSLRLEKVKQQLASLETQLALLQEQQMVGAQLAALQQQYQQLQHQQAAPTAVVDPSSSSLYHIPDVYSSGGFSLLPAGGSSTYAPAAVEAQSAPIPTISAPAGDAAFIPFVRAAQGGWASAAPVASGLSAGLPPVAGSTPWMRTHSLPPFPSARDRSTPLPKMGPGLCGANGRSGINPSCNTQPLPQLGSVTQPLPQLGSGPLAPAAAGGPHAQFLGLGGGVGGPGSGLHTMCSAPILHMHELLPGDDIPDLEAFLAAGGGLQALDHSGPDNVLSGDDGPSSHTLPGPGYSLAGTGLPGVPEHHALPRWGPALPGRPLWQRGPLLHQQAKAAPLLGGSQKGRSSFDMFAGLLEDVLAEIQAETAAAAATAAAPRGTMQA